MSVNRIYSFKSKKKFIDKRLKYLREQLKTIKKRDIFYTTSNLLDEQQTKNNQEYEKRVHHLLNLYDKQINNLNLWHFYRSDRIEQMYIYELRQSNENFQIKKVDFKYQLLSTLNEQRRCLQLEHENLHIHCRSLKTNEQSATVNQTNVHLINGHRRLSSKQSSSRPTYFLRRTVANENIPETSSSTISLKDVSIFSRSQSLLPPFGGIELQCCLTNTDIEQDLFYMKKTCKSSDEHQRTVMSSFDNERMKSSSSIDVRIEDGRLWYKCAWFARNTPILLVFDDLEVVPGLVLSIGRNDLLVRRSGTNIKHRISLSLLHDGHVAIRKRNCLF